MRFATFAILVTLATAASAAHASFVGLSIRVTTHAVIGSDALPDVSDDATVGPGVEFAAFYAEPFSFDIDVSDDVIRISNFDRVDHFDALDFNGLIFSDEHDAIAPFTGVVVLDTTTMAGLDATRVRTAGADRIEIDWGGLFFTPSTVVEFRVGFGDANAQDASAVPLPTAAPAGVAMMASLLLRRRRPRAI